MTEAALRTAVEEHTTSKIEDIDDLERGVGTLGFRGEALHTIGAVSRLTIRSKPRGGSRGTELVYEGGELSEVRPVGCPEGTVVEVRDLFFNTPARRKFLKTETTEFDHVNTVVTQYALANPDVAVSLEHDDRELFATEGRGSREAAVLSVYGRDVAESMLPVDDERGDVTVEGLVSDPETTRSTREYLSTFVNGRYVTSSVLREAVLDAYGGQLAPDRYPFVVLFLRLDPGDVDVNVHPRKMEVRFDDEAGVRRAVTESVESALLDRGLIRSSAPRGRSRAGETEVQPESPASETSAQPDVRDGRTDGRRTGRSESASSTVTDDDATATDEPGGADGTTTAADATADTDTDADGDGDTADTPGGEAGTESAAVDDEDPATAYGGTATDHEDATETSDGTDLGAAPSAADADEAGAGCERGVETAAGTDRQAARDSPDRDPSTTPGDSHDGHDGARDDVGIPRREGGSIVGPGSQRTLSGEAVDLDRPFDRLPRLCVLGQLHETYIVAASDEGLVLIDQHAADERVNYERLRAALDGETPTQALAEPVELELTAREAALFDDYREALAQVGFHAGRVDGDDRRVAVRTVPAVFDATLDPDRLRDALAGFVRDEREGARETVDAAAEELVADLACYPSVTGNTSLTEGSVVDLLEALDDCENPYACPHGRPTIIRVDRDEIDARFERDYPGHAGRRREE
jgi:DNA mismatch repair protein MutL